MIIIIDIIFENKYNIIDGWEKPRSGGLIGRSDSYELIRTFMRYVRDRQLADNRKIRMLCGT